MPGRTQTATLESSAAQKPSVPVLKRCVVSLSSTFAVDAGVMIHPPLKWSDLRYIFDSQEGHDGKEALQV